MVSGQLPPEETCPPVTFAVWIKVRISFIFGLGGGGNQAIAPERKIAPLLGLGFGLGLVLALGGNFPRGQLS